MNHDATLRSVTQARDEILALLAPLAAQERALTDPTLTPAHVVADELRARRALPGFDNSAMDGVGVRVADVETATAEAPVTLRLKGEALPGAVSPAALGPGEAVRIMTGAPVPPGVEAIVMREQTDERGIAGAGGGHVRVLAAARAGQHVRRRGEDVDEGAVVAAPGAALAPARVNLLLAAGHTHAQVHRAPRVAIVSSGDELVEPGAPAGDRHVINSNAHAIAAAVREAGAEARVVGIARDSLEDHVARMRAALADPTDVLITIGGVSMGTHDFVRPALEQLGCTLDVWRVAMRPGKPVAFGRLPPRDGAATVAFGLPGNPVSAMVAFELFVRPALRRMMGHPASTCLRPLARGTLRTPTEKKAGLEHWARAVATWRDGALEIELKDAQGSHQISGLAGANALARLPRDATVLAAGAPVDVMLL